MCLKQTHTLVLRMGVYHIKRLILLAAIIRCSVYLLNKTSPMKSFNNKASIISKYSSSSKFNSLNSKNRSEIKSSRKQFETNIKADNSCTNHQKSHKGFKLCSAKNDVAKNYKNSCIVDQKSLSTVREHDFNNEEIKFNYDIYKQGTHSHSSIYNKDKYHTICNKNSTKFKKKQRKALK